MELGFKWICSHCNGANTFSRMLRGPQGLPHDAPVLILLPGAMSGSESAYVQVGPVCYLEGWLCRD